MRYDSQAKPQNFGCIYNPKSFSRLKLDSLDPLSPLYARSRYERSRPPKPIEHNGSPHVLVGVNSSRQLVLRDQSALHLDIRIECFAERVVVFDGITWRVDHLAALPDPLDFTKPPRRVLHLKRWTSLGEIRADIDEPDNLRAIFPSSEGEHTLGPVKHGIVRMIPTASRRRVLKPLESGQQFEARLRGRELDGPFQIEVTKDGRLIANNVSSGGCLAMLAVEPEDIAPSYARVNCPDFGGCFDIDSFLYLEDKLRCRAMSVKAIKAPRPTNDQTIMFGILCPGQAPLLTNGLHHLEVFERFIRCNTIRASGKQRPRQLTILNLSMCDQGDAKTVVDALVDFRKHNPDAKMSIVVSKLGPTAYMDTPGYRRYVKLLEENRIHVDMFTGVEGPTRQVVHAKAVTIDDKTLFSTGAIVDTKPIDKADFSIELPPAAAEAFQAYVQNAILGGASDERRARLTARLASLGVVINDPIASLTYISRAQHTLLRGARRDLLVSVSELVDPKIAKLLVRRVANGVTVTIQVREIDHVSSRILAQAMRRYGKRISVEDVSSWEPRPHYNVIIADGCLAYLGSSYFWPTQRNMIHQGRSLENGVLLDGDAVRALRGHLDELKSRNYS
ncbi:long-chain-fatty-acid ligase [Fusarium longipes]|uniref:Long-chain-fatty-acid ligase n=1 Tax=Fusarium longipes TaxID=694270 RepID=A0A395T516_9HYPO|nr:long-chain-fatty-acid ligase [Fusarium longipes]